jgi:ribosomal protein L19
MKVIFNHGLCNYKRRMDCLFKSFNEVHSYSTTNVRSFLTGDHCRTFSTSLSIHPDGSLKWSSLSESNALAENSIPRYAGTLMQGKNLIQTLAYEAMKSTEQRDERFEYFNKKSSKYVPTGSILKASYYSYPLPEGLKLTTTSPQTTSTTNVSQNANSGGKTTTSQLPLISTIKPTSSVPATSAKKEPFNSSTVTSPQTFIGVLIAVHRNAVNTTFTLRNSVDDVGVEITFSLCSPLLHSLQVLKKIPQHRSKWYWLRECKDHKKLKKIYGNIVHST